MAHHHHAYFGQHVYSGGKSNQFNGAAISTFIILHLCLIILILNLIELDSAVRFFGSSVQIGINFQMFLNSYNYILLNYTSTL